MKLTELKAGDKIYCKEDLIYPKAPTVHEQKVVFTKGKHYTVDRLQINLTTIQFVVFIDDTGKSFAFSAENTYDKYVYVDYFCNLKELRIKKLKELCQ